MQDNDLITRERIMQCTLELVKSERDYSKITVRRIVSAAGVNLSAVNYYFGSKAKLINEVIKRPILEFLAKNGSGMEKYADDPVRRLKETVKLPARYLAENPNISRISILSDMTDPIENDLTEQTVKYLMPPAIKAFPNMEEKDVFSEMWGLVTLVQASFLRSRNFCLSTGIDYFNDTDRNKFLDTYIDRLVEKNGGSIHG